MTTATIPLLTEADLARCGGPAQDEPGLGALRTARGNLPLKLVHVDARVTGLLASTTLRQTFVNTLGVPLEATYVFPLPDRAAVTRFRLEVGERVVEGVVQERGQARATYDQALADGHRAAIAEEERPGVFTLRVGNLVPGDEATVWLDLAGPLPFADGEATFQLPLVVAPRYMPGRALDGPSVGDGTASDTDAVPDASRISPPVLLPGFPSPVRLSIEVEVDGGGLEVSDVRSSLHTVRAEPARGGATRVRLVPGERLDRDFVLRFRLGARAGGPGSSLVLRPDPADAGRATFMLTVVPPADAARGRRPKDVVVLLDRSGSMRGWKMVAARRATARLVDTLADRDRFAVYAFDDRIDTPPGVAGTDLGPATDRVRFKAVEFLAGLEARGGTELARPLALALTTLLQDDRGDRDKVLVLVTDGQVGNEDQLLRTLGPSAARLRVFTLGIDQAVNAAFLRRLAALGAGSCELVESEDRLDEVMAKVHRRIDAPVLTGVRLAGEGLDLEAEALVPARHQDVFPGQPLVVLGRCRAPAGARGALTVEATDGSGEPWRARLEAARDDAAPLGAAWARGQVRQLEDRYVTSASSSERADLERRILGTALAWGVLCRFTAYVAVDRAVVANRGGGVHRVVQAVEAPAGWAELGAPAQAPAAPAGGRARLCAPGARAPAPAADRLAAPGADPFAAAGGPPAAMSFEAADVDARVAAPSPSPARRAAASKSAAPEEKRREAPAAGGGLLDGLARAVGSVLGGSNAPASPPPPPRASGPLFAPPPRSAPASVFSSAPPPAGYDDAGPADGEGLGLDGYRRRAEALVALVAAQVATADARRRELGRLLLLLEQLLEDLRSVGAPRAVVAPLEALVTELVVLRGQASLAEAELERLWRRAGEALGDFVRGAPTPAAPAPPARREFWK